MAHNIEPKTKYAVVNVRMAIEQTNPDSIADGLNEWLTASLGDDFLADYEFTNSDNPYITESSDKPEEGELFIKVQEFVVCLQDPDYQESWYRIRAQADLNCLTDDELRNYLSEHIVVGQSDRVFVSHVSAMHPVCIS